MPCNVSSEEIAAYEAERRKQWEREGRWDLLATKEQLAGWLCDAPTAECQRWHAAHVEHNDKATVDQPNGEL